MGVTCHRFPFPFVRMQPPMSYLHSENFVVPDRLFPEIRGLKVFIRILGFQKCQNVQSWGAKKKLLTPKMMLWIERPICPLHFHALQQTVASSAEKLFGPELHKISRNNSFLVALFCDWQVIAQHKLCSFWFTCVCSSKILH